MYRLILPFFMVAVALSTKIAHHTKVATSFGLDSCSGAVKVFRRPTSSTLSFVRSHMSLSLSSGNDYDEHNGSNNPDGKSYTTKEIGQQPRNRAILVDDTKSSLKLPLPKKVHTVTVCVVPPPEQSNDTWDIIQSYRVELKDPGYYRWPPHINLLYPFLQLKYTPSSSRSNNDNNNGDEGLVDDDSSLYSVYDIVRRIELVTRQFLPFKIVLDEFGTFGGKRRGVLWLNPSSFKTFGRTFNESEQIGSVSTTAESSTVPPLHELQRRLEEAFPMCRDQSQKGDEGSFVPHMTISHFECLHDAQSAQRSLLEHHDNHGPMSFLLDRIYLLERKGDSGQFLRVAQIALGSNDNDDNYDANQTNRVIVQTQIFDPPSAFPTMPKIELDWVLEERMKLKKRRNGRGKAGWRRNSRPREERTECIHDTPEIIAAKRAERKAKRECVLLMRSDEEGDEVVRHDMDNS